jgi:hypothetical protein
MKGMTWDDWWKEIQVDFRCSFTYLNIFDQLVPFDHTFWPTDLFLQLYIPIAYPKPWEGFI